MPGEIIPDSVAPCSRHTVPVREGGGDGMQNFGNARAFRGWLLHPLWRNSPLHGWTALAYAGLCVRYYCAFAKNIANGAHEV